MSKTAHIPVGARVLFQYDADTKLFGTVVEAMDDGPGVMSSARYGYRVALDDETYTLTGHISGKYLECVSPLDELAACSSTE